MMSHDDYLKLVEQTKSAPNAVIVHGLHGLSVFKNPAEPSPSNRHWLPWLQKQLVAHGIKAQTPEMPLAYAPNYELWRQTFEQFPINSQTILVGHSCGGGFLVRWLSEHNVHVKQVVLVAPWLDVEKRMVEEGGDDFFNFIIDPALVAKADKFTIFESTNDMPEIKSSQELLEQLVPNISLNIREFENCGHFCESDLHSTEFPALAKEILGEDY